jgi:hypothetical protein
MAEPRRINAAELLRIEGKPSRKLYEYSLEETNSVPRARPRSFMDKMRRKNPSYEYVDEKVIIPLGRFLKHRAYSEYADLIFEKMSPQLSLAEDADKVILVHEESRSDGAGDPTPPGGSRLNKKTRRSKGRRRYSVRRKLRKLTSRRR